MPMLNLFNLGGKYMYRKHIKSVFCIISLILTFCLLFAGCKDKSKTEKEKKEIIASVNNDFTTNVEVISCGEEVKVEETHEDDHDHEHTDSDVHESSVASSTTSESSSYEGVKTYQFEGKFKDIEGKYEYVVKDNKVLISQFSYDFYLIVPKNLEEDGQSAYWALTDEEIKTACAEGDKNLKKALSDKFDKIKWRKLYIDTTQEVIKELPDTYTMLNSFSEDTNLSCYTADAIVDGKAYSIRIVFYGIGNLRLMINPVDTVQN